MIISQTAEEIKAAVALQTKCELKRVGLRTCHASLDGNEGDLKAPFCLRVSHSSIANTIVEGLLRIEGRFHVQGYDSSEPPALLFSVECAFDLDYEIQDKTFTAAEESIIAFKDGNAIFNCWPYARELVSNVTSRMDLHVPALPFLRLIPKPPTPTETRTKVPEESPAELAE